MLNLRVRKKIIKRKMQMIHHILFATGYKGGYMAAYAVSALVE